MRTILTLYDDVAVLLQETARRTRTTVKQIVNSTLHAALALPSSQRAPYRETVHHAEPSAR